MRAACALAVTLGLWAFPATAADLVTYRARFYEVWCADSGFSRGGAGEGECAQAIAALVDFPPRYSLSVQKYHQAWFSRIAATCGNEADSEQCAARTLRLMQPLLDRFTDFVRGILSATQGSDTPRYTDCVWIGSIFTCETR